jgi:hypothetical protein
MPDNINPKVNKPLNKNKIKFNIIDFIIILLVVACVGGIYVRYNLLDKIGVNAQLKNYEITFIAKDLRYSSLNAFEKDANVRDRVTGNKIGIFKEIETTSPASVYVTKSDGAIEKLYYPENTKIDVKGKIIVRGIMSDNGFLLEGKNYIATGTTLKISTEKLDIDIVVEALNISVEQQ